MGNFYAKNAIELVASEYLYRRKPKRGHLV